ncbi:MAG: hypothetical protein QOJ85_1123, partial [Solirubrobacteraceae bacterium]|nr:hypothetical protein [Solirubrobacteraceae bacterium]
MTTAPRANAGCRHEPNKALLGDLLVIAGIHTGIDANVLARMERV